MRLARLGLLIAVAALLAVPAPALAGEGSDEPDALVVITGGAEVGPAETVGDVFVVDGDVVIDGDVEGDVVAIAGDLLLSGHVTGDVTTIAGRARLTRDAQVDGDLSYGDERPLIAPGAQVDGDVTDEDFDDISIAPWAVVTTIALWIAMTLSLLVLGVMLIAMLPRVAEATATASRESLWESIAIGISVWIALGVLGFFALFTLVGIPFGLILLSAVIPAAALGYVAASFALGRRVAGSASPLLAFLAGFGILRGLALIPFLGALVSLLAATFGIGFLIVAAGRAGAARRQDAAAPRKPAAQKAAAKRPVAKKTAAKKKPAGKKRAAAKKPPAR